VACLLFLAACGFRAVGYDDDGASAPLCFVLTATVELTRGVELFRLPVPFRLFVWSPFLDSALTSARIS
jgi:hypothetical protein